MRNVWHLETEEAPEFRDVESVGMNSARFSLQRLKVTKKWTKSENRVFHLAFSL